MGKAVALLMMFSVTENGGTATSQYYKISYRHEIHSFEYDLGEIQEKQSERSVAYDKAKETATFGILRLAGNF